MIPTALAFIDDPRPHLDNAADTPGHRQVKGSSWFRVRLTFHRNCCRQRYVSLPHSAYRITLSPPCGSMTEKGTQPARTRNAKNQRATSYRLNLIRQANETPFAHPEFSLQIISAAASFGKSNGTIQHQMWSVSQTSRCRPKHLKR